MDLGTLTVTLGVDASGLLTAQMAVDRLAKTTATAATKANASLASVATTIGTVSQKFRTFGYLASSMLTVPIVMAGKAVTKMAMEFEFSMSKIESLVGISSEQVNKWKDDILEMSKTTAVSPLKLAESLYFVTSAGFKSAEALKITEMAAKGSMVGMGEAAGIADMLTSAMNAYRESGLTAARAMDIFTAAVREGKIEPEKFVSSIGSVLPIAAEVGATLEDVTGAMAAMSLSGASAANASTYLRNVLQKLMDPSVGVQQVMAEMGTSSAQLTSMIRDKGLLATLAYLRDLTEEYGTKMTDLFPNIRALIGALNLTGQNYEYNKTVIDSVINSTGDFNKAAEIAAKTMKVQFANAMDRVIVAGIKLGEKVGPALVVLLEYLAKKVEELTEWFTSLNEAAQQTVLVTAAVLAALGPLSLIISLVGYTVQGLVTGFGFLIVVASKFVAFPWLGPLSLALIIIAKLVAKIREHNQEVDRLSNAQKSVQSATEQVNSKYVEEASSVQKLLWMIRNHNIALSVRLDTLKQLKALMPSYTGELTKEGKLLKDNTTAIDGYLAALKEKIRAQIFEDRYTQLIKEQVTATEELRIANEELAKGMFASQKFKELGASNKYDPTFDPKAATRMFSSNKINVGPLSALQTAAGSAQTKLSGVNTQLENLGVLSKSVDLSKIFGGSGSGGVVETLGLIEAKELQIKRVQDLMFKAPDRAVLEGLKQINKELEIQLEDLKAVHLWRNKMLDKAVVRYGAKDAKDLTLPVTSAAGISAAMGMDNPLAKAMETNEPGLDKFIQWLKDAKTGSDDLYVAMYRVGEQIGKSLQMGADSWSAYGDSVKEAARQFITAEIAKATAAAITNAMVTAGGFGPLALAAIPVLVGAAIGLVNTAINQIPGFATGGIVGGTATSGDSILARVNSGEMILTRGQQASMYAALSGAGSSNTGGGTVVFRIQGTELVGILNKMNRKSKIT